MSTKEDKKPPRQENIQEESKKTGRKPLTSVKFRKQEENFELLKPQTRNLTMLKPVIDKKISSKSDKSKNSSKPVKSKPCASIFLPRDKNIHLTTQELPHNINCLTRTCVISL